MTTATDTISSSAGAGLRGSDGAKVSRTGSGAVVTSAGRSV